MTTLVPGPGPKPAGPTHPTPTHPPKGNGHRLPTDTDPRVGSVTPDAAALGSAVGAGVGPITSLPRLLAAIRLEAGRAYAMTRLQWDPASGPQQCDPFPPSDVDMRMAAVAADLRSALSGLDRLRRLTTDPADAPAPGAGGRPAGTPRVPAGASSVVGCGRSVNECRVCEGQDCPPPFSLPVTKRFLMPGAVEIAAGINEALARRGS